MEINCYDFDKTIYDGDSTIDFYWYCLKKRPYIIISIPIQLYGIIGYKLGLCSKTKMKEKFFSFVRLIPNIEKIIKKFGEVHSHKLKKWYLEKDHSSDVIISASPVFIIKSITTGIKVLDVIASDTSEKTGKFLLPNCYGEEKVIRFKEKFPSNCFEIRRFYSDSISDLPLARIAEESFLVNDNTISKWNIGDN